MVARALVSEAPIEHTELGLVCKGGGWYVVNAGEARWPVGREPPLEPRGRGAVRPARDESGRRVGRPGGSAYEPDPVAAKYGAAPEETTEDPDVAYAAFPPRELVRYGGWLPQG